MGECFCEEAPYAACMERGLLVFAIVFLLLPLLALGLVLVSGLGGLGLALAALTLLAIGFTVALGFVPVEG